MEVVRECVEGLAVHDFDEVEPPAAASIDWRHRANEHWLRRAPAAQLFLSAKTIDFHLGNIYRKLGIRSLTELARQLPVAETAGLE
jgi:hypothetical protein